MSKHVPGDLLQRIFILLRAKSENSLFLNLIIGTMIHVKLLRCRDCRRELGLPTSFDIFKKLFYFYRRRGARLY